MVTLLGLDESIVWRRIGFVRGDFHEVSIRPV